MCNWGLRNSGRHQAIKVLSQRREELWDLLRGKFMAVLSTEASGTLSAALLVLSSRTGLCWHFPLLCPGRQGGWRKPTRKPARCPNKCMISKSVWPSILLFVLAQLPCSSHPTTVNTQDLHLSLGRPCPRPPTLLHSR